MYVKIIDNARRTHFIETEQFVFLGWGDNGLERAMRESGAEPVTFLDYFETEEEGPHPIFFQVLRGEFPESLGAHPYAAWLMSDEGKTLDNILCFEDSTSVLPEAGPPEGNVSWNSVSVSSSQNL